MDEVRLDKYLWSIRVYKTRTEATTACNGGKVRLNGADTKPSKAVKVGDEIVVRKGPVTYIINTITNTDTSTTKDGYPQIPSLTFPQRTCNAFQFQGL